MAFVLEEFIWDTLFTQNDYLSQLCNKTKAREKMSLSGSPKRLFTFANMSHRYGTYWQM